MLDYECKIYLFLICAVHFYRILLLCHVRVLEWIYRVKIHFERRMWQDNNIELKKVWFIQKSHRSKGAVQLAISNLQKGYLNHYDFSEKNCKRKSYLKRYKIYSKVSLNSPYKNSKKLSNLILTIIFFFTFSLSRMVGFVIGVFGLKLLRIFCQVFYWKF